MIGAGIAGASVARALTALGPVGRSAYLDRIERQSKEHAAESDSEAKA